jgi:hypothetical protein
MVRATPLRWREASTAVPQARMDFQIGAGKGAWAETWADMGGLNGGEGETVVESGEGDVTLEMKGKEPDLEVCL